MRYLTLAITMGLIALLAIDGQTGLTLFWGIAIPVVPAILVVAPGLWRQICPMAMLNQLPRRWGFSAERTVSERWLKVSFPISVGVLVVLVSLREPLLNHSPAVLAGGLTLVLTLAFVGGLVFKGRSGWCGTFCPMTPVERTYGQAPLIVAPNGHCPTCVGCQPNCYDLNPRAAVFKDVLANDPQRAWLRRLFMALLPGLILGYFIQGHQDGRAWLPYEATLLLSCTASIALYLLATKVLPIGHYRLTLVFSAAALMCFYWFVGPVVAKNLGALLAFETPDVLSLGLKGLGAVAGSVLLLSGLRSERHHRRLNPHANLSGRSPKGRTVIPIRVSGAQVLDRETGTSFNVPPGDNLLTALRAAGLPINHNCHAGLCGLDAVEVCEGGHHMSPPGETELATLRRLGLEGRARLACMCDVHGNVTIDRSPKAHVLAESAIAEPAEDLALLAGLRRVVVVGNGVAGSTAVEALRRASPSVDIDLIGDESGVFYNRMALGQLITGESRPGDLDMLSPHWAHEGRTQTYTDTSAQFIDRELMEVVLHSGERLPYDRLILATGAEAALPQPGFLDRSNAFVLRRSDDAIKIRSTVLQKSAGRPASAVVIGGGVLGVEAALALVALGTQVVILERADRLMANQLDAEGAERLASFLATKGIQSIASATIDHLAGETAFEAAVLQSGERVAADLFVACLGVRPRIDLAQTAGLQTSPHGIQVDAHMRTNDPAIFAIGDVVQADGPTRLWSAGARHAETAVAAMLGQATATPSEAVSAAAPVRLKCDEIDIVTSGNTTEQPGDTVWTSPATSARHWKVVLRANAVVGSLCVGPPGSAKTFTSLLEGARDPAALKASLTAL